MNKVDLKTIKDPKFLENLSKDELSLLCCDIREHILDVVSKNGGHLSSNLGAVEATVALCKCFDFEKDKIIFDVGHQTYTYKILTGRDISTLRQKDGISGFQKKNESKYDCFECGHSSTSISAAMGFAKARDLSKEDYKVVAFIGDASFENGLAMEALNNLSRDKTGIIIVLNDNEMSIGKTEGGISKCFRALSNSKAYTKGKQIYHKVMNATAFGRWLSKGLSAIKNWFKRHLIRLNIFDLLGIRYLGVVDGHNIKKMEKAFKKAKTFKGPVVVHLKTKKGKGVSYAENDKIGIYHGLDGFNKETGELNIDTSKTTWSTVVSNELDNIMKANTRAVTICPATTLGSCLVNIKENYPDRFFDVGINEEHSVVFASGLATNGYHPFISMYSTFLQRAYDQVSHDLSRMNLNCTLLIDRAGLVGNDGETHQGIYDVSYLNSIPNITITMPSSSEYVRSLLIESLNNHGVFAIRYPKEKMEIKKYESINIKYGEWIKELEGNDTAIVSFGPVINELKMTLKDKNIALYNAIYLKPILDSNIDELLKYNKIIIYDIYGTESGFSQILVNILNDKNYKGKILKITVPNIFVEQGSISEQKEFLNINIDNLIKLL